jgi:hypothetical protein
MKPLYDNTAVLFLLRAGINKGYWTLEDLDTPPPGYIGKPENFRNLLRDENNSPERVQVVSPRDFVPSPDPLPIEPNQELDGTTIFTNHPDPDDLPF